MAPNIADYLNRTVLASIPTLFADSEVHRCRLIGLEGFGVWLNSDELSRRVVPARAKRGTATVAADIFVPFAQIGAIVPLVERPVDGSGLESAAVVYATPPAAAASARVSSAQTAAPRRKRRAAGA